MNLILCSEDRKYDLFEQSSQDKELVVALEQATDFFDELKDLFVDAWLNQGKKHVTEMLLI